MVGYTVRILVTSAAAYGAMVATVEFVDAQTAVRQTDPYDESLCAQGTLRLAVEDRVRVVVAGNLGLHANESESKLSRGAEAVLRGIFRRHEEDPYDFGLTVGGNFLPDGVRTEEELRRRWAPYSILGIPFFATLGVPDYRGGGARTQVDYTTARANRRASHDALGSVATWNVPCSYYSFSVGPIRLVAVDTVEGRVSIWKRLVRGLLLRFGDDPWSVYQTQWVADQLRRVC